MSEIKKRVLVAIAGIPALLAILYYGGYSLVALFLTASAIGFYEYRKMMKNVNIQIGFGWVLLNIGIFLSLISFRTYDMVILWLLFIAIVLSSMLLWSRDKSVLPMLATFFGIIYTGFLPALIVRIGLDHSVQKILLALILMIWIVDSVAYFVGMRFGKHRNVTEISPMKSMEGFIAGALVPYVILGLYLLSEMRPISSLNALLICFAAGVVGQLGDLCESMLKRFCGVKDSSGLIPGHGGVLDRMDSLLLAGSFMYVAIKLFTIVR